MNYRHAYHAGNHTEVFKHAVLVMLLEHLLQKDKPFMVLDTHAGIGVYDLEADEAMRTGEKTEGIERIHATGLPSCPRYLELVRSVNHGGLRYYPGSPELVRRMIRPGDRLIACELHPVDFQELRERYARDRNVLVQNRNGYEAVNALLPPRERRGLVFIDPPYEDREEVRHMTAALRRGIRKWASGIFCLWYPIKDSALGDRLADAVASFPKALRIEFLPFARDGMRLAGSGMIICNTPWQFEERAARLCDELARTLGRGSATWSVRWLSEERAP